MNSGDSLIIGIFGFVGLFFAVVGINCYHSATLDAQSLQKCFETQRPTLECSIAVHGTK